MRHLSLAIAATALTACSSIGLPEPGEGVSTQWLLIPAAVVTANEAGYVTTPNLITGVTLWALLDPLAPNWEIRAAQLDERHVRFSLTHKLLHTGGAGEARQVFQRNAERFALEQGFTEFDVIRYEEGIQSTRPFARRVATAEVVMVRGRTLPGL